MKRRKLAKWFNGIHFDLSGFFCCCFFLNRYYFSLTRCRNNFGCSFYTFWYYLFYLFWLHLKSFYARKFDLKSIFVLFSIVSRVRANLTRQNFKTNWLCEFSKLVHWVWKASERQSLSTSTSLPLLQLTPAATTKFSLSLSLDVLSLDQRNSGKFRLTLFGKFGWREWSSCCV